MSKKIKFWCDSGANASSCYRGETTFEELGVSEAEWDALTDDQRDDLMRDLALGRLDWGYVLTND